LKQGRCGNGAAVAGKARTPLWSAPTPAKRRHRLGKVQNLRRAARAFDGLVIPTGATFSFWRQIGQASRTRGFATGGCCMVPAAGGGLCQLSNALYDVALQAGCTVLKRHAHSRRVGPASAGRDATVAWNYVDLRFRPARTVQLRVLLNRDELIVRLHGSASHAAEPVIAIGTPPALRAARSCASCAQTDCFRHESAPVVSGRGAFLLDEMWPEFVNHLKTAITQDAWIGCPRPGRHRGRLADQLPTDATDLMVAQCFLPHLWRAGHLDGRRFSVLMTRPPLEIIQARLNAAHAAHLDRAMLADDRTDPALVRWRAEALAAAEQLATPYAEIASLFPGHAVHLDWHRPAQVSAARPGGAHPRRIAVQGPTLARKGAFEVRDVARLLDLEVMPLGAELEGADFWAGVKGIRPDPSRASSAWLAGVDAVVQPALMEEQPRRLLAALTAGLPSLVTRACGLDEAGVSVLELLDTADLADKLRRVLGF